ncbi:ArgE/DapE family deacylase [Hutsoniella sourekii]
MDKERKIKILQDVIQIETINDNEEDVAKYYQELLKEFDIDSEIVNYEGNRSNLVAEIKGEEEGLVLVLSGHMDVVDLGDRDEWTVDPFGGEIKDGKMYGRGTTDMKAGLTALVIAMIELKEAGNPFKGTLRLAATVGEEIGMYGSKQLVKEGYVDDADGFIIAEPSGPEQIINAHKGSLQYEVIAKGKPAHSSMPENGIDALQLMVDYINRSNELFEEAFSGKSNEQMGETINVNTVINGGDQINSVCGRAVLKANARTVPEADNAVVIETIQQAIEELNQVNEGELELNILQDNPSVESPVDNDLVKAIRVATNEEIPAKPLMGATDASNFGRVPKDIDLAIYGPGTPSRAHTHDEYVEVDQYIEFIDIYVDAVKEYLK